MDDREQPKTIDRVIKACRKAFVTLGAFSFCINLLVLTVPIYMVQVFDRVMTSHSEDTLLALTLAALLAFAVMAVLDVVRSRILVRIGLWFDRELSPGLFAAALGPAPDGAPRSLQCMRDVNQVRNFLTGSSIFALLDAPWMPLYLFLIFVLHPALGSVALAGAVMLFALGYLNEVMTRDPLKAANRSAFHGMTAAETMVRQADAAQGMGMVGTLAEWWSARNDRTLELQALASDRAGLIMALSRFLRLALQIMILGLGALLVVRQDLSIGAMIAGSIILARALAPVEQSIGVWRNLLTARTAFRRIRETLGNVALAADAMPLPRPKGHLQVEGLVFTPEGRDEPVFRDIAFTARPGEFIGITGPSGAGKSSLVRMLLGVAKPARGRVRVDGADVAAWAADDLGRHVGYVPQVVELLSGTVRENIARFTDAAPERVIEAARWAGVHDLVLRLPDGYDTVVGGANDVISVGVRQRLALARALFGDPRLLILDEPYSNLDGDGLRALMAAVQGARARGATIVMVAHRPSILTQADRVLLIENGRARIVEKGRPAKLTVLSNENRAPVPAPAVAEAPPKAPAATDTAPAPADEPGGAGRPEKPAKHAKSRKAKVPA